MYFQRNAHTAVNRSTRGREREEEKAGNERRSNQVATATTTTTTKTTGAARAGATVITTFELPSYGSATGKMQKVN